MDAWRIALRIVHIGSAMIWFGGAVVGTFFLDPTARAVGKAGQLFMAHLIERRRMGTFFPTVAALTILSGAVLYWRDSGGAASGLDLVAHRDGLHHRRARRDRGVRGRRCPGRSERRAHRGPDGSGAGQWHPDRRAAATLDRADRRMRLAARIDLPVLIVAALTMAAARYL